MQPQNMSFFKQISKFTLYGIFMFPSNTVHHSMAVFFFSKKGMCLIRNPSPYHEKNVIATTMLVPCTKLFAPLFELHFLLQAAKRVAVYNNVNLCTKSVQLL